MSEFVLATACLIAVVLEAPALLATLIKFKEQ